jgi:hypothetical protein
MTRSVRFFGSTGRCSSCGHSHRFEPRGGTGLFRRRQRPHAGGAHRGRIFHDDRPPAQRWHRLPVGEGSVQACRSRDAAWALGVAHRCNTDCWAFLLGSREYGSSTWSRQRLAQGCFYQLCVHRATMRTGRRYLSRSGMKWEGGDPSLAMRW